MRTVYSYDFTLPPTNLQYFIFCKTSKQAFVLFDSSVIFINTLIPSFTDALTDPPHSTSPHPTSPHPTPPHPKPPHPTPSLTPVKYSMFTCFNQTSALSIYLSISLCPLSFISVYSSSNIPLPAATDWIVGYKWLPRKQANKIRSAESFPWEGL